MKKNMGSADKAIRYLLAVIAIVLYLTNTVTGITGIIILVIAGVLVLTNLISFCPLYTIFGINTIKLKS